MKQDEAPEAPAKPPEKAEEKPSELWFFAYDEEDEEWFGPFSSKEQAVAEGEKSFVDTRFVVAQASVYDESSVGLDQMDDLVGLLNEEHFGRMGGSTDSACVIKPENRHQALLDLRDWLRRWCKPEHVLIDGEMHECGPPREED